MSTDKGLAKLKKRFFRRPNIVLLRKQFEETVWKGGESFCEFIYNKTILANKVTISEDERIDYIVDAISDIFSRNQKPIQCFNFIPPSLLAFEKVTLQSHGSTSKVSSKHQKVGETTKVLMKKSRTAKRQKVSVQGVTIAAKRDQEIANVEEQKDNFLWMTELQLEKDSELYNMVLRVLLVGGSAESLIKRSLVDPKNKFVGCE